jgi:hypothetical protein
MDMDDAEPWQVRVCGVCGVCGVVWGVYWMVDRYLSAHPPVLATVCCTCQIPLITYLHEARPHRTPTL